MIRKLIILITWALTIAGAGAFWGLCLLVGDPNIAPWPSAVAGGAAGALAIIGLPLMIIFLVQYSHQRGRHAAPIIRSRSRYATASIRIRPRDYRRVTASPTPDEINQVGLQLADVIRVATTR